MSPEEVYNKFRNGDALSDAEISFGIAAFMNAADSLRGLGPVFRLAQQEAHRVYMTLSSYQQAREANERP